MDDPIIHLVVLGITSVLILIPSMYISHFLVHLLHPHNIILGIIISIASIIFGFLAVIFAGIIIAIIVAIIMEIFHKIKRRKSDVVDC
jgi:hypothetical protein